MKKVLLFLIAGLSLYACKNDNASTASTQSGQAEQTAPGQKKNIIFFGNSLTAAYQLAPEQGFPALIQKKIDALGLPYNCINAGVSGETSMDGANRIGWVLQQPVDIFVLELGANDALRGLPLKETKTNLQSIIDRVKAVNPACKIVIAGMQAPPNLGQEYTITFKELFKNLAAKNGAAVIPFLLEGVAADPALNLEDGIHPNVEGHKIVAENVWKVLGPLLSK
jgi:acyl-CoA thioesterase-1